MARYSILHTFYCSEAWIKFRLMIIAERGLICEYCHQPIVKAEDATLHHIKELAIDNVNDVSVALNPDNVIVIHHHCHNQIHKRFGNQAKKVFIVYGPPLSGKTTFVKDRSMRGDIIVDMDRLYEAVSMQSAYDKPDNLLANVRAVQSLLIDNIKTRYGKWYNAWIIGGYADKYQREKLCDDLGAELIFMNVSKDECIARLNMDTDRLSVKTEWAGYIEKWFNSYVE